MGISINLIDHIFNIWYVCVGVFIGYSYICHECFFQHSFQQTIFWHSESQEELCIAHQNLSVLVTYTNKNHFYNIIFFCRHFQFSCFIFLCTIFFFFLNKMLKRHWSVTCDVFLPVTILYTLCINFQMNLLHFLCAVCVCRRYMWCTC